MNQEPEYAELIPAYLSKLLQDASPDLRRPIESVCPYCQAKHTGPFQACSPCKTLLDAGQG